MFDDIWYRCRSEFSRDDTIRVESQAQGMTSVGSARRNIFYLSGGQFSHTYNSIQPTYAKSTDFNLFGSGSRLEP